MRIVFRLYLLSSSEVTKLLFGKLLFGEFNSYQEAQNYIENKCFPGEYSIEKVFVK